MKDTTGNELTIARAEVERLEAEAKTIPFTKTHKASIEDQSYEIAHLRGLLGFERDETAGRGWGVARLKTIDAIQSRLDGLEAIDDMIMGDNLLIDGRTLFDRVEALEAAASKTITLDNGSKIVFEGLDSTDTVRGSEFGTMEVLVPCEDAPATVSDTVADGETNESKRMEGERAIIAAMKDENRAAKAARQSAETIDLASSGIKMMTPDEVDAYHRRDQPNVATINDLIVKIKEHAATIGRQRSAISFLHDQNDELVKMIKDWASMSDDQAATIGKLEAERDLLKSMRREGWQS